MILLREGVWVSLTPKITPFILLFVVLIYDLRYNARHTNLSLYKLVIGSFLSIIIIRRRWGRLSITKLAAVKLKRQ